MARLAALVPKPRVNLTRFHGVFAPNSVLRKQIAPKARCKRSAESETRSPAQQYVAMTWAQRLKRVFKATAPALAPYLRPVGNIDIETCQQCGGAVKVVACIEDPAVIKQILDYLQKHSESAHPLSHPVRAPQKRLTPFFHNIHLNARTR